MHQVLPQVESDGAEDASAIDCTREMLLLMVTCDTAVKVRRAALQCLPFFLVRFLEPALFHLPDKGHVYGAI